MKFQELLAGKQIDWDRVKLIRHNLTKEEVAANYERGVSGTVSICSKPCSVSEL